jgi:methyl acetate hydrolase
MHSEDLDDLSRQSANARSRRMRARRPFELPAGATLIAALVSGAGGRNDADCQASRRQALQSVLEQSIDDHRAQFTVGMIADSEGIVFSGAAGEAAPGLQASSNTVFRIFSMSKAIGSTAAMILIDRGQLTMDTTVESVLPEFGNLQVLDGFDSSGKARFRAPAGKATVRNLATHTSGLEYEFWRPEQARFLQNIDRPGISASADLKATLLNEYPLMTDPGTRWGYGVSIDWLGLVVEKISGQGIMEFLKENLLIPLGMKDTEAALRDDMQPRLASLALRGADGEFGDFPLEPPATADTSGMGHALYSTPNDYAKFLRMILNGGTLGGQRILSEAAVAKMLANQMPQGLAFEAMISVSPLSADFNPFPGIKKSHGFGFMRVDEDVPGMRRAGSVAWAGVCNSHYWIDPMSGIAGIFMTQLLPFVEAPYMEAYQAFERAAYS